MASPVQRRVNTIVCNEHNGRLIDAKPQRACIPDEVIALTRQQPSLYLLPEWGMPEALSNSPSGAEASEPNYRGRAPHLLHQGWRRDPGRRCRGTLRAFRLVQNADMRKHCCNATSPRTTSSDGQVQTFNDLWPWWPIKDQCVSGGLRSEFFVTKQLYQRNMNHHTEE